MQGGVGPCEARAETVLRVSSMFHWVMQAGVWSSRRWMALEVRRKCDGVVVCWRRLQSLVWACARLNWSGDSDGREPGGVSMLLLTIWRGLESLTLEVLNQAVDNQKPARPVLAVKVLGQQLVEIPKFRVFIGSLDHGIDIP